MGFLKSTRKNVSENIFEKQVKPNLAVQDGYTHIIMINSFGKWINEMFCCDNKYTVQMDSVLTQMQDLGYQILDVKINHFRDKGFGGAEMYSTTITYK